MSLLNLRIIISRPKFSGNIGAIARLAANFDIKDLWVVAPRRPYDPHEAKIYAMGSASDYLNKIQFTDHLPKALETIPVAVGLTRRTGQMRNPDITIKEMAHLLSGHPLALVFGSEEGGLLAEEVAQCQFIYRIPTADIMPSLNLSHAVAVLCARLYEERQFIENSTSESSESKESKDYKDKTKNLTKGKRLATNAELVALKNHWYEIFKIIGLSNIKKPDELLIKLHKIFSRSLMTHSEANALRGVLSKIQKTFNQK